MHDATSFRQEHLLSIPWIYWYAFTGIEASYLKQGIGLSAI